MCGILIYIYQYLHDLINMKHHESMGLLKRVHE